MSLKFNHPNFLFVGTAKAGTTSLFHYLKQHPEISIPIKETFYFIRDKYPISLLAYPKQRVGPSIVRSLEEYESHYSDISEEFIGEIGTGYLHHYKSAIPEIKKTIGTDVKICIILRNPVERTYSGYMHFKRFSYVMSALLEEIELEGQREKEGYDFMWQFSIMSFYAPSVKAYLENFKKVRIFYYENLISDTSGLMKELYEFIGVDSSFKADTSKAFNPSGTPKNNIIQKIISQENLMKKVSRPIYHKLFGKKNVEQFRDKIRDANVKKEELDGETRSILKKLFTQDIDQLQELIGNSVNLKSLWK